MADDIKSSIPNDFFEPSAAAQISADPQSDANSGRITRFMYDCDRSDGRLAALEMHAELANWDRDVEPDGLRVHVFPLDDQRIVVPVEGNITMRLIGHRYRRGGGRDGFHDL